MQADLVARREDLDLILFEQSKNVYGQEFSIYLQLEQEPSNESLLALYSARKTASFISDVIH